MQSHVSCGMKILCFIGVRSHGRNKMIRSTFLKYKMANGWSTDLRRAQKGQKSLDAFAAFQDWDCGGWG